MIDVQIKAVEDGEGGHARPVQGYLAHKKKPPPRNLQEDQAQGPMAILGEEVVSYERGTTVVERRLHQPAIAHIYSIRYQRVHRFFSSFHHDSSHMHASCISSDRVDAIPGGR